MAKESIVKAEDKWGKFAGGCLIGEPYVRMFIPQDKLNKSNHVWIGLNGDEAYLAVGKNIEIPAPIAEIYNNSYQGTIEAESKINTGTEIQS